MLQGRDLRSAHRGREPRRLIVPDGLNTFKLQASVLQLPLAGLLEQQPPYEARDRCSFGKIAQTSVRSSISAFRRSGGLVEWICSRSALEKPTCASPSFSAASVSVPIFARRSRSRSETARHCYRASASLSWAKMSRCASVFTPTAGVTAAAAILPASRVFTSITSVQSQGPPASIGRL